MRTTTRNLEMKANIAIMYVGQLERWRSNLQRKLHLLVVCVFVDLDGDALQFVLLIRGVNDFSSRQRLENQIEVSQARSCLLCSR